MCFFFDKSGSTGIVIFTESGIALIPLGVKTLALIVVVFVRSLQIISSVSTDVTLLGISLIEYSAMLLASVEISPAITYKLINFMMKTNRI